MRINQVTGLDLFQHRDELEAYLGDLFRPHLAGRAWMRSAAELIGRFQLLSFAGKGEDECRAFDWDRQAMDDLLDSVATKVRTYIPLEELTVTVVPALPFRWFREFNLPLSRWSNAFTNGPGNLVVAVPPEPDWHYLANLIAHECHHASAENPIYGLTLETFTLAEWLKMEGCAEYFGHLLFPDDRWWWPAFPVEMEPAYWQLVRPHLDSADDAIKGRLAFGSKAEGVPTFAGYTFGFRAVAHYMACFPGTPVRDLFQVSAGEIVQTYIMRASG